MEMRITCMRVAGSLFLAVLAALNGCGSWQPQLAKANLTERTRIAYRQAGQPLPNGPFARSYERGWKQAYVDYARGSNGQLPTVPPGIHRLDRCADGREYRKLSTWYRGYQAGLEAAQRACGATSCVGEYCEPETPVRGGHESATLNSLPEPLSTPEATPSLPLER